MSVDWKKRALAAEGKLSGYARLRETAEKLLRESFDAAVSRKKIPEECFEELRLELMVLDEVDPPRDFLGQRVEVSGNPISIRLVNDLGDRVSSLRLDGEIGIDVNASVPDAAKYVGLLFQLVQLADIAAASAGSKEGTISASWIQDRAPSILALLIATGLLNPQVPVTVQDLAALEGE